MVDHSGLLYRHLTIYVSQKKNKTPSAPMVSKPGNPGKIDEDAFCAENLLIRR